MRVKGSCITSLGSIQFDLQFLGWTPPKRTVQGESSIKKLAQGEVPPLFLKNVETGGPETAFAFLKMWKLAFQHVAKGGNYRAGSCKTYQNRGLGSCTMSVSPNMWTSNIGSQPESPSYFLKMLVLGRPIRLRLLPK